MRITPHALLSLLQRLTVSALLGLLVMSALAGTGLAQSQSRVLSQFLQDIPPADIAEGADAFGPMREDVAVAPVLKGGQRIGWVFITSDFVGTTGYSGKPIHTMVALDDDARILGVQLVKHSEPIVLIGIPDSKIKAMAADYKGLNLVEEAAAGRLLHPFPVLVAQSALVAALPGHFFPLRLRFALEHGQHVEAVIHDA